MIGYVMVGTNDLKKVGEFYDKICGELGMGRLMTNDRVIAWGARGGGAGFGVGGFGVAPGPGGSSGMLSWQAAQSVATLAVVSRRKTSRRRIIGAIVDFVCFNARPYVVRKDLGRPRGS